MKRCAHILLFLLATAFLAASCGRKSANTAPMNNDGIYDTAIWMLKEFVTEGPDSNLGFSNFAELNDITLRRDQGIDMYYLIEDSLLESPYTVDHHLLKMGRRIYPVYYHNQLRAAITFDTTPYGWRPTVFDDSNVIASYIADSNASKDSTVSHGAIVAPSIHNHIIFRHTKNGDFILPTKELQREMAENYPGGLKNADLSPVSRDDFFKGLKQHVKKIHKHRKPRKRRT